MFSIVDRDEIFQSWNMRSLPMINHNTADHIVYFSKEEAASSRDLSVHMTNHTALLLQTAMA